MIANGEPVVSVACRPRFVYIPATRFEHASAARGAMNTSFFGELLQTISERGRALLDLARDRRSEANARSETLVDLCEELLSGRGEASGVALAREILARYADLTTGPRIAFFEALATRFGPDHSRIAAALEGWRQNPSDEIAAEVHH